MDASPLFHLTGHPLVIALILLSALGSGLVAGVLFGFSTFVMRALARLPAAQGITAMQAINVAAINPPFMLAIFGTAAGCVLLVVVALGNLHRPAAVLWLLGGLLYLGGTVLVTMVCNVPRNNALAKADPASPDGARLWAGYLSRWTAWNHVRTVSGILAAAALTAALALGAGPI